ncbi:hypothetical protein MR511_07010 [bacterium]|nr:hypothetical protein [bacterium]
MKVYSPRCSSDWSKYLFLLSCCPEFDSIRIICSSYYILKINGTIQDFGPERCPKGYARIKEWSLKEKQGGRVLVSALHYGFPAFDLMEQDFWIGVELLNGSQVVATIKDFEIFEDPSLLKDTCRYSFQRGLIERYDLSRRTVLTSFVEREPPLFLKGLGQTSQYREIFPSPVKWGSFSWLKEIVYRNYLHEAKYQFWNRFDIDGRIRDLSISKCHGLLFDFGEEYTGLFHLKVRCQSKGRHRIHLIFDEILCNGKFQFGRESCSNYLEINFEGKSLDFNNQIPYCFRYVLVLTEEELEVKLSAILVQNDKDALAFPDLSKPKIEKIYNASMRTWRQNAFDIYSDCPGRERAGWLCDSYFMGLAEQSFFGSREMERQFLENILLCDGSGLPKGMLPMCYPSDQKDGTFIPQWALWFVLELHEYLRFCQDDELLERAKPKLLALFDYFKNFENEYGLLENLEGWSFIEWSKAADSERMIGVHFPTNMLYAEALEAYGRMTGSQDAVMKARECRKSVSSLAWSGAYYCDNAVRDRSGILRSNFHFRSETGQYMAVLFQKERDSSFLKRLIYRFSLSQKENPDGVVKSAPFIGNILRLMVLLWAGEKEKGLQEISAFYFPMAVSTSTLWEKEETRGSLNHGFSSVIGHFIREFLK